MSVASTSPLCIKISNVFLIISPACLSLLDECRSMATQTFWFLLSSLSLSWSLHPCLLGCWIDGSDGEWSYWPFQSGKPRRVHHVGTCRGLYKSVFRYFFFYLKWFVVNESCLFPGCEGHNWPNVNNWIQAQHSWWSIFEKKINGEKQKLKKWGKNRSQKRKNKINRKQKKGNQKRICDFHFFFKSCAFSLSGSTPVIFTFQEAQRWKAQIRRSTTISMKHNCAFSMKHNGAFHFRESQSSFTEKHICGSPWITTIFFHMVCFTWEKKKYKKSRKPKKKPSKILNPKTHPKNKKMCSCGVRQHATRDSAGCKGTRRFQSGLRDTTPSGSQDGPKREGWCKINPLTW